MSCRLFYGRLLEDAKHAKDPYKFISDAQGTEYDIFTSNVYEDSNSASNAIFVGDFRKHDPFLRTKIPCRPYVPKDPDEEQCKLILKMRKNYAEVLKSQETAMFDYFEHVRLIVKKYSDAVDESDTDTSIEHSMSNAVNDGKNALDRADDAIRLANKAEELFKSALGAMRLTALNKCDMPQRNAAAVADGESFELEAIKAVKDAEASEAYVIEASSASIMAAEEAKKETEASKMLTGKVAARAAIAFLKQAEDSKVSVSAEDLNYIDIVRREESKGPFFSRDTTYDNARETLQHSLEGRSRPAQSPVPLGTGERAVLWQIGPSLNGLSSRTSRVAEASKAADLAYAAIKEVSLP